MTRKYREVEKANTKKANEHLNKLINMEEPIILSEICRISKEEKIQKVKDEIDGYKTLFSFDNDIHKIVPIGRLWLLIGIKNEDGTEELTNVSLTVGQSVDIINELHKVVDKIFDESKKDERDYSSFRDKFNELVFYEVEINNYLNHVYINKCPNYINDKKGDFLDIGIEQVLFEISKEYLAEATLGRFKTGALYWNFYNSGLDYRAYCYVVKRFSDPL